MLQVFSTSIYDLHDLGSIFSFVNPLLVFTYEILPDVLHDPIVVSTPLGENSRTDRVHKDYPVVGCCRTMCASLVELPMHDFDIILGMDRLHKCLSFKDCCSRVVRFCFIVEEELVWELYNSSRPDPCFPVLRPIKLCPRGYYVILLVLMILILTFFLWT